MIASCSRDGTARAWDSRRKKETAADAVKNRLFCLRRRNKSCLSDALFNSDERFLVSAEMDDETLQVWDPRSGQTVGEPLRVRNLYGFRGVALTPDGRCLVSDSGDDTIRLWHLPTRKIVRTLGGHISGICCVAVPPEGDRAVTGSCNFATLRKQKE